MRVERSEFENKFSRGGENMPVKMLWKRQARWRRETRHWINRAFLTSPQTKLSDIFLSYIFLLALSLKENVRKENVKELRFQNTDFQRGLFFYFFSRRESDDCAIFSASQSTCSA
jgi:hypothetical protein